MTTDKVQKLTELVQELYREHNRSFVPRYPWLFVMVLPKEQQVGSIILPEGEQNKTVHEGIVLKTWAPFEKMLFGSSEDNPAFVQQWTETKQSIYTPGDHVLFPHWAGQAIKGFDDKRYRVVMEEEWSPAKQGGIFAKIEYEEKDISSTEMLAQMLFDLTKVPGYSHVQMAKAIESKWLMVDKEKKSVTLSGR